MESKDEFNARVDKEVTAEMIDRIENAMSQHIEDFYEPYRLCAFCGMTNLRPINPPVGGYASVPTKKVEHSPDCWGYTILKFIRENSHNS